MASLDPRMPIFDIIAEPLGVHQYSKAETATRVEELMELVGLDRSYVDRYPQQFSGGQRQRIGIARALALEPQGDRAGRTGLRAGRLHSGRGDQPAGRPQEPARTVLPLRRPRPGRDPPHRRPSGRDVSGSDRRDRRSVDGLRQPHPSRTPRPCCRPSRYPTRHKERSRERILLKGDLPSPANPPSGCRFRTRCPKFHTLAPVNSNFVKSGTPTGRLDRQRSPLGLSLQRGPSVI